MCRFGRRVNPGVGATPPIRLINSADFQHSGETRAKPVPTSITGADVDCRKDGISAGDVGADAFVPTGENRQARVDMLWPERHVRCFEC